MLGAFNCLRHDLKRRRTTERRRQRYFQLGRTKRRYFRQGNRRLARQLVAHVCAPATAVDLCDAAAFIGMHIDHTRLRVVAETAVKCDDRTPS